MATRVFSAVLPVDTRFNVHPNLADNKNWNEKCDFLDQSLARAELGFGQLSGGTLPAGSLKFFLAPEYFFGLPTGGGHSAVNAYDEQTKNNIVGRCGVISGLYPDILIVPGTLLYKRRIGRTERGQIAATLQQQAGTFAAGATQAQLNTGYDNVRLKGWGIKEKVTGNHKLFGYNAGFVYHGAQLIQTLNKADNANEFVAENPKPILVPGGSLNSFMFPGTTYKIGLEICADHGRLRQATESVDVQLYVSAANPLQIFKIAANVGGLVINCTAGDKKVSGLYSIKAMSEADRVPFPTNPAEAKKVAQQRKGIQYDEKEGIKVDTAGAKAGISNAVVLEGVQCQMAQIA